MRDSCQALEKQLEKRHTYVTQSDLQSFNAASEAGKTKTITMTKRHTYVTQSDLQSFNAASEACETFAYEKSKDNDKKTHLCHTI